MNPNKNKQIVNFGYCGNFDFSVFRFHNTVPNDYNYKDYAFEMMRILKSGTKEFNSKVLNGVERLTSLKSKTDLFIEIENCVSNIIGIPYSGKNNSKAKDYILELRENHFNESEFVYKLSLIKDSFKEKIGIGKVEIVNDPYFDGFFGVYFDSLKRYNDTSYFDGMKISKNPQKLFENGKTILMTIFVNFKSLFALVYSNIDREEYARIGNIDHKNAVNEFMATFISGLIRDQNRIRIAEQTSLLMKILSESEMTGLTFINTINSWKTEKMSLEGEESRKRAWKIITDIYGDQLKEFEMNSSLADLKKEEKEFGTNFDFISYTAPTLDIDKNRVDQDPKYNDYCCEEPDISSETVNARDLITKYIGKYNCAILDPLDLILTIEGSPLLYPEILRSLGPKIKEYIDNGRITNCNTNSLRRIDIRDYDKIANSAKIKLFTARIIPFLQLVVFANQYGTRYTSYSKVMKIFASSCFYSDYNEYQAEEYKLGQDVITDYAVQMYSDAKEFDTKFKNPMLTSNNVVRVVFDGISTYSGVESDEVKPKIEE